MESERELTPSEGLEMMWQPTVEEWAARGVDIRELRTRKDVVRIL